MQTLTQPAFPPRVWVSVEGATTWAERPIRELNVPEYLSLREHEYLLAKAHELSFRAGVKRSIVESTEERARSEQEYREVDERRWELAGQLSAAEARIAELQRVQRLALGTLMLAKSAVEALAETQKEVGMGLLGKLMAPDAVSKIDAAINELSKLQNPPPRAWRPSRAID